MTLVQDLRIRLTKQIMAKADARKKILKVDKFYFNQPIDGVVSFYGLPQDSSGSVVQFFNMKGSTMVKILNSIESGDIYGWIEYKGSRCKIKPKKIAR